ncbi:DUF3817 domain-containing protein [Nocardiopsis composta]
MSSSAPAAPRQRTEPVLTAFRIIAAAEAVTWVGLLIGMFFKRVVAWSELGVQIFGPLHGIAFIVYVVVAAIAWYRLRWGLWTGVIALAASVPRWAPSSSSGWPAPAACWTPRRRPERSGPRRSAGERPRPGRGDTCSQAFRLG